MDSKRNSNIELARFFGAIMIMIQHIGIMGFDNHVPGCRLYVEFFLIITGYYTVKHFDRKNYDNPIKESIIYTIKKFIPLLPYTIVTTILMYILNASPRLLLGELSLGGNI